MNSPSKSEAGFSLIETLVALFIIATLAVSGATLLVQTLQSGKQVERRMSDLRAFQIAHALLKEDLAALVPRATANSDTFAKPFIFGTSQIDDRNLLTFTRNGWQILPGETGRSDLQRITYRFEDGALIRTAWIRPDATSETPKVTHRLIEGLDNVSVQYRVGNLWLQEWQTGRMPSEAPSAIEITFDVPERGRLTQVFLTGAAS